MTQTDRKMRNPKMTTASTSLDNDALASFVEGADPLSEIEAAPVMVPPWEGLRSTPKVRMMLLIDPADKARLEYLAQQDPDRSEQSILRRYIEPQLRAEADKIFDRK